MSQNRAPGGGPKISVIVPVYNVQDHVGACLASLRAQRFDDFEVIVVDDGATDASAARAEEAMAGDARFRLIRQENRGLSGARNTGLDHARGDLIAFVDSDDRVADTYLLSLYQALTQGNADWVACAVRSCFPDGSHFDHSAIHGQEASDPPDPSAPATRHALTDWADVIRHFPSAWNKLYRRSLIEGLRFDEGTWFEDHAFFQQAAARTDHILHLPQPLYLQTRERPGQITGQDSDRVFEQLSVLERLEGLMGAQKTGAHAAFEALATRLLYERRVALADPDRRARFAAAARDFLAARGLRYTAEWDAGISRSWGKVLEGRLPLSVVIPSTGDLTQLEISLPPLAEAFAPEMEVIVVTDAPDARLAARVARHPLARHVVQSGSGAGPARLAGLAGARGDYVLFLDAGDVLRGHFLTAWLDQMYRQGGQVGSGVFRTGLDSGPLHSGLYQTETPEDGILRGGDAALALLTLPSAKVYDRAFVLEQSLKQGPEPLAEWGFTYGAALRAEPGRLLHLLHPAAEQSEAGAARRIWHAPVRARDLHAAIARTLAALEGSPNLPPGWRRRLALRAFWEKLHFARWPTRGARLRFALAMAWHLRRSGWLKGPGALDPHLGRLVRGLTGVPRRG